MLPPLDERGLLPEGIHLGTWAEIENGFGHTAHRAQLINNVKTFSHTELLPLHPCPLYLAGSTFSDKQVPSDIEATIKVDANGLSENQLRVLLTLHMAHDRLKQNASIDFYVTLDALGANDFSAFFQYVGDKTAAIKGLDSKDKRGVVEVEAWNQP